MIFLQQANNFFHLLSALVVALPNSGLAIVVDYKVYSINFRLLRATYQAIPGAEKDHSGGSGRARSELILVV